jgi:hypothetical protein
MRPPVSRPHSSQRTRGAYAARLGNPFQPSCNVDAICEDIVVVDDEVSAVDADSKFDPVILRQDGIVVGSCKQKLDVAVDVLLLE